MDHFEVHHSLFVPIRPLCFCVRVNTLWSFQTYCLFWQTIDKFSFSMSIESHLSWVYIQIRRGWAAAAVAVAGLYLNGSHWLTIPVILILFINLLLTIQHNTSSDYLHSYTLYTLLRWQNKWGFYINVMKAGHSSSFFIILFGHIFRNYAFLKYDEDIKW